MLREALSSAFFLTLYLYYTKLHVTRVHLYSVLDE